MIRVFCDFDGTISPDDLGDRLFQEFGQFEPHHSDLIEKRINIRQYWHNLCRSINEENIKEKMEKFISQFDIDSYFEKFVKILESNNIELIILSDGYNIYINDLLKRNNLDYLRVYSNKLIFENNIVTPIFTNENLNCNCFSASCKRNILINNSDIDDILIYIGDGYSDFCPASHCDIIFAKKNLAAYCNENKIPHYPWKSFFDIIKLFETKILTQKLKKRHNSKIKIKNAIEGE